VKVDLLTTEIRAEEDLVPVRQRARHIAELLGFTPQDQTRIATAVSELARNAFQYAGGGRATFGIEGEKPSALVIRVTDNGPGIADVDAVLSGRFKSTSGLGRGIVGAKLLMDRFRLVSAPGKGTTIELAKNLLKGAPEPTPAILAKIAEELAQRAAPSPMQEVLHQNRELLQALADARQAAERLQEQLDFTRAMAGSLGEGVIAVDLEGRVTFVNRAAQGLLGWTDEGAMGRPLGELTRFAAIDGSSVAPPLEEVMRTGGNTRSDAHVLLRMDGSWLQATCASAAIRRDDRTTGAVITFQDVSDRRSAEKERAGFIEGLQRTARFNEMFVGVLGHDLRNPLSAITTAASLVLMRTESERISKPTARILASAERMARMIDQILDFTRIRLGTGLPLDGKPMDLGELTRAIVAEFQGEGGTQQIRYELSGDLAGEWDRDRLAQVLSNLVGNARHHGTSGTPIYVGVDGRSPDFVMVTVGNRGTIPPELLPVIFEPLRMGTSRHARSTGLGLGLFITHQIAAAHGGSIGVESNDASGTTFSLRLPRQPSAPQSEQTRGHEGFGDP
jgi:PAS domain S-box-containing protein